MVKKWFLEKTKNEHVELCERGIFSARLGLWGLGNTLPIKWPVVFVWGLVGGVCRSVGCKYFEGGSFWGYWIFHFFSFCNK